MWKVCGMCKFINIQQSTKTKNIIAKKLKPCKFINIQQSTKTTSTKVISSMGVSLSISNRVLKPRLLHCRHLRCVSLSISNRVLKRSGVEGLNKYSVSLSISNRVLKLDEKKQRFFNQCKFINIQQSTKTPVTP